MIISKLVHRSLRYSTDGPYLEMIAAVIFFVGLSAVSAQTAVNGGQLNWYCDGLKGIDCSREIPHPKCGTDGVTYRNFCAFASAHCKDTSLNQTHDGPCTASEATGSTTTFAPQQIIQGSQIILDFQCILLDRSECHHTIDETICGTDNVTYVDFCEYEKARCGHRNLHVQKLGAC